MSDAPAPAVPAADAPTVKEAPAAKDAPAVKEAPAVPIKDVPRSAIELRLARRRILIRRYGIFVGLPTLLAIIYYVGLASAQYDARLVVAVETAEGRVSAEKTANAGNQRDAQLLGRALVGSKAIASLVEGGKFLEHYANNGNWFSALAEDAGESELRDYYRDKVTAVHEAGTNIVKVRVRAFSGQAAHDFAARLVEYSETWVTQQNAASSKTRLELANAEVERARARMAEVASTPESIDFRIAEKRLEASLQGAEQAQLELGRAQRRLVVLDGPSKPDAATLPRRAWSIVTVLVGALLAVSVVSLLGSAIREHAKF